MKNIAIVLFLAILMALASVASAVGEDFSDVPISQSVCVGADKITDPLLAALFCKKLAIQWYDYDPDCKGKGTKSILVLDRYYSPDKITGRYAWSGNPRTGKGEKEFVARIEGNALYVVLSRTAARIEIIITQKKDGAFKLKGTYIRDSNSAQGFSQAYGNFKIIE